MANFEAAYKKLKENEGGYSDVAGDAGGETYAGITSRDYPKWPGWKIVRSKPRKHNEKIPELDKMKSEFYKSEFWDKIRGDEIDNQEYAYHLLDMAVNKGHGTAIKLAQDALGIAETGKICDDTLNAINGKLA